MSIAIAIVQEKAQQSIQPEAEFLDVIGEKSLRVFPPCYSQSPLHAPNKFTLPPPLSNSGLNTEKKENKIFLTYKEIQRHKIIKRKNGK
jgi:hypothetical protein